MAARPRRTVRNKALRLAGWNADRVRGTKLELEHFLSPHDVNICLLSETFLNAGEAFRLANYVYHLTDRPTTGRYSHPGPPCYSSPLRARFGPDPLGDYCHPSYFGWQTGENPCGLPLYFPPIHRSGPYRSFRRGIAGPDGRWPQRQTRGLELAAEHEAKETPP
jgi:hypothetical protein